MDMDMDMDDEWDTFFQNDENDSSNHNTKNNYDYTTGFSGPNASSSSSSSSSSTSSSDEDELIQRERGDYLEEKNAPKCSDIYISTKTKISYFNKPIVLNDVFWNIPIMPYHTAAECAIKKQMKFNSSTPEELRYIQQKVNECLNTSSYVEEHIIVQNHTDTGRVKFKDVRKISIGLRKKDITSNRCKKKSAFYNCFVIILRTIVNGSFHEINAKVFNTGKIEIPGIQTKEMLDNVLILLTSILKKINGYHDLDYIKEKSETVLINSNFRCGYFINREKLYNILKYKYNIKCAYDPCSYPGILCEYYYEEGGDTNTKDKKIGKKEGTINMKEGCQKVGDTITQKGVLTPLKVSFMIFRTGSILIVGKCEEDVLQHIYLFIKNLLEREYSNCYTTEDPTIANTKKTSAFIDNSRKIKKVIITSGSAPLDPQ
jgi:hypothetical protein